MATGVLLVGLGFVAGKVPANSVGTTQIKNNSVASVDLKNGSATGVDVKDKSLRAGDLADGVIPAPDWTAFTSNSIGGCGNSGWCFLPTTAATAAVVASLSTPPPNSSLWSSTGDITVTEPTTVLIEANVVMWYFGTILHDAVCMVKDGDTLIAETGGVRDSGNVPKTLDWRATTTLAPGDHLLRILCYETAVDFVAPSRASLTVSQIHPL